MAAYQPLQEKDDHDTVDNVVTENTTLPVYEVASMIEHFVILFVYIGRSSTI